MPSYILRVDREEPPLYVVWSTVVDDVTAFGSRAELQGRPLMGQPEATADERFDRADATGTSDMYPDPELREGRWEDSGFVCQQMWLPRASLRAYALALAAGGDGAEHLQTITVEE